jgi:hypothetical protein
MKIAVGSAAATPDTWRKNSGKGGKAKGGKKGGKKNLKGRTRAEIEEQAYNDAYQAALAATNPYGAMMPNPYTAYQAAQVEEK